MSHPDVNREKVSPPIFTLGKHLYACGSGEAVECYFSELGQTNKIMEGIFPAGRDLMMSFVERIALENGLELEFLSYAGGQVEHGTLRLWGSSSEKDENIIQPDLKYFALPHEDLKETNSSHPMLSQIRDCDNIHAIILCLQAVDGREPRTVLWNKELTLDQIRDQDNKSEEGSYGYSTKVLRDSAVAAIRLTPGDIGILPAHKIHSVVGYDGASRCTLSGFMHFIKDDDGRPVKIVFRT